MGADPTLKYLAACPPDLRAQARMLVTEGRLSESLARRCPERHDVASDGALYGYVQALKSRYMRNAGPLATVLYDGRLHLTHKALGTHTAVSRLQGGKLKAKREIRIGSLCREAPAAFLRMIVVHELAQLKERGHDKVFHALCTHMEPGHHQLEFDVRLWLTGLEAGLPQAGAEGGRGCWAEGCRLETDLIDSVRIVERPQQGSAAMDHRRGLSRRTGRTAHDR